MKVPRLVLISLFVVSVLPGCATYQRCLDRYGITSIVHDTIIVQSRPVIVDTLLYDTIAGSHNQVSDTIRDGLKSTISRGNITSNVDIVGKILVHSLDIADTIIPRQLSLRTSATDILLHTVQKAPAEKKEIPKFYLFTLYYFIITFIGSIFLLIYRLSRRKLLL